MKKQIKRGIQSIYFGLVVISLMACVNSSPVPNTYYYVLESQPVLLANSDKTDAQQVKVKLIELPDYMKQPNLVLKLSDHQIKIANYHFWAENLQQSLRRVLINDLNQAHSNISFTQQCLTCDELSVTIDHYYPTESGDVVLSGSYEIRTISGELKLRGFTLKTELNEGGFDESVAKMRTLLNTLALALEI